LTSKLPSIIIYHIIIYLMMVVQQTFPAVLQTFVLHLGGFRSLSSLYLRQPSDIYRQAFSLQKDQRRVSETGEWWFSGSLRNNFKTITKRNTHIIAIELRDVMKFQGVTQLDCWGVWSWSFVVQGKSMGI
jgi:hypothetical protein